MDLDSARTIVERAVLFLAGRCDHAQQQDGAGFNAYDAHFGHTLADEIAGGGHVRDIAKVRQFVGKYRTQLTNGGIELPSVDVVDQIVEETKRIAPPPSSISAVTINPSATPGALLVSFPYSQEAVANVKTCRGARWNPATKQWSVPSTDLGKLRELFPGAVIDPSLVEAETKAIADAAARDAHRRGLVATALARYEAFKPALDARIAARFGTAGLFPHQDEESDG